MLCTPPATEQPRSRRSVNRHNTPQSPTLLQMPANVGRSPPRIADGLPQELHRKARLMTAQKSRSRGVGRSGAIPHNKNGAADLATPYRDSSRSLVETTPEAIFHAAGERTAAALGALLSRRSRRGGPDLSRPPVTRGPVIANTTPPNITMKPTTDRIGKLPIMVALNATPATSIARPITNRPRPAVADAGPKGRAECRLARSRRTWGPRHRERSRSDRACAAHDRRVAFVPPCRPGRSRFQWLPAFTGQLTQ